MVEPGRAVGLEEPGASYMGYIELEGPVEGPVGSAWPVSEGTGKP